MLYLHRAVSKGWIFHITRNDEDSWLYDHRTSDEVIYSEEIVVALKVAIIPSDMHDALRDRLGVRQARVKLEPTTHRFGDLTCRTWLLRALQELDDEGYISIKASYSVEDLEDEAKGLATNITALVIENGGRLSRLDRVFKSDYSRP